MGTSYTRKDILDTSPMSLKYLNDNMKFLWLKTFGNITNADISDDADINGSKFKDKSITAKQIDVSNLYVGEGGIRLDDTAKITWGQVTGTDNIAVRDDIDWNKMLNKPTDLLTQSQLTTALEDYVTTGIMTNALKDTLNLTNFKTIITKDYIASMNLVVGKEILMGDNAVITWANLTDDAKSKLQVKFQYSADNSSWHDTYVNTDVYLRTSNDGGTTWSTGVTIKGTDGVNGTNGTNGSDAYVPEWVKNTVISNGYVASPLLQGNCIYTSSDHESWLSLEGATIRFIHNGTEVFKFTIDGADAGKPQIFFNNGCSIDTYNGSLRLRTSDNNYLRVNKAGGLDYIYHGSGGDKTIQIVGADGTYSGGGSGGYLVFA